MVIRTPDLLHASKILWVLWLQRAQQSQRQLQVRLQPRPAAVEKRGRLQDAASGQSASANSHGHGHPHAVQARPMTLTADGCRTGRRSNDGQMIFLACPAEPGMTS